MPGSTSMQHPSPLASQDHQACNSPTAPISTSSSAIHAYLHRHCPMHPSAGIRPAAPQASCATHDRDDESQAASHGGSAAPSTTRDSSTAKLPGLHHGSSCTPAHWRTVTGRTGWRPQRGVLTIFTGPAERPCNAAVAARGFPTPIVPASARNMPQLPPAALTHISRALLATCASFTTHPT